jgi:hypothetical protein
MTLYKRDYHRDWSISINHLLTTAPADDQPTPVKLALAVIAVLWRAAPGKMPVHRVIQLTGCDLEDLEALVLATKLTPDPVARITLIDGWIQIVPV